MPPEKQEMPTKGEAMAIIADEFDGLDAGAVSDSIEEADDQAQGEDTVVVGDGEVEELEHVAEDDTEEEEEHLDGGEDEDEEEGAGEGVDRGDGRDETGKFAKKAESDAAADGEAPPAGEKRTEATGEASKPAWQPLAVSVDKGFVPIEEASVQLIKEGDKEYAVISVPKEQFRRFHDRLARGHLFERNRQEIVAKQAQLDKDLNELKLEREAPQVESDAEVEARVLIQALRAKIAESGDAEEGATVWNTMFTPQEQKNIELEIELAKVKAKESHTTERTKYFDEKLKPQRDAEASAADERTQAEGVINSAFDILQAKKDDGSAMYPELQGMTEAQIRAAGAELMEVKGSVYWKDTDGWYVNTQLIYNYLKRHATAPSNGSHAPSRENTASGTGAKQGDKAAERFNKGVDTGAKPKPQSTSLKNRRDTRPRDERNTRKTAGVGAPAKRTAEQSAEDDWNRSKRKLMSSPTLDFEDDEGDE